MPYTHTHAGTDTTSLSFSLSPASSKSTVLFASDGRHFDPLHGHSFQRLAVHDLPAVAHTRLFFRDCVLCQQRMLSLARQSTRKRRIPESLLLKPPPSLFPLAPTAASPRGDVIRPSAPFVQRPPTESLLTMSGFSREDDAVCQCADCGNLIHRECLSLVHAHRRCRAHHALLPHCPHTKPTTPTQTPTAAAETSTPTSFATEATVKRVLSTRRSLASTVTISSLIDELSGDSSNTNRSDETSPSKPTKKKTTTAAVMKRAAPFLAAGGVIGAIALGPAGAALASLNMLVASVTMEGMVAGLGFTAATAAATASHQLKKHNKMRLEEEMKTGAWAMKVCWKIKQQFKDRPSSDEVFRKDAELLRRFQLPRRTESAVEEQRPVDHFAPSNDEVYRLLFRVFSSSTEFLSQVHEELLKAFQDRFTVRYKGASSSSSSSRTLQAKAVALCKDTLQDAKMYVAHLVGATFQCFPSLASTDAAMVSCTQAVERMVFDDIYKNVMGVVDAIFADENALFYASLEEIRRQQGGQQLATLLPQLAPSSTTTTTSLTPTLLSSNAHLADAERKLTAMMEKATSPLLKLELLCGAFRSVCVFADQLHQTASNADILIPIVCAVLVASPQFQRMPGETQTANFVSQVAFTSFFTGGGGKGVEGYVLTTLQAALQVIAAVDLSRGHAQELQLFATSGEDAPSIDNSSSATDDDDQDEFFDASS